MSRRVFQKSCGIVPVHIPESGEPLFLLLHSGQVRNPRATWEFPKGGMDKGESEKETALRECREETGLPLKKLVPGFRAMDVYMFSRPGVRIKKLVVYYLSLVDDPDAVKTEPDGREHVFDANGRWYQWLTYEKAMKTLYHSGQRRILTGAWEKVREIQSEVSVDSRNIDGVRADKDTRISPDNHGVSITAGGNDP